VAAAFDAVGLDWRDHVVRDERFVRPNDGSHPLASVAETTERLGWTATVQLPEPVQRMVSARQSDEAASVTGTAREPVAASVGVIGVCSTACESRAMP
jgi:hypothetical protein